MADALSDTEQAQFMKQYGITRIPADQFRYKAFRYSNLRDAIAQAKRDQAR